MDKEDVIKKYKGKILAFTLYSGGKGDYYVDDFANFDGLEYPVLGEINDHETDITEDGISFLKEYYGFENLAKKLYDIEWYRGEYPSTKSLVKFLENLNPYISANFIANVQKGADAMEELNRNKDKLSKTRLDIEDIINLITSLEESYSRLNDKDKINFVTQSYGLAFSFPNDVQNFVTNLDSKLGEALTGVERLSKEQYANKLFDYFKAGGTFL